MIVQKNQKNPLCLERKNEPEILTAAVNAGNVGGRPQFFLGGISRKKSNFLSQVFATGGGGWTFEKGGRICRQEEREHIPGKESATRLKRGGLGKGCEKTIFKRETSLAKGRFFSGRL